MSDESGGEFSFVEFTRTVLHSRDPVVSRFRVVVWLTAANLAFFLFLIWSDKSSFAVLVLGWTLNCCCFLYGASLFGVAPIVGHVLTVLSAAFAGWTAGSLSPLRTDFYSVAAQVLPVLVLTVIIEARFQRGRAGSANALVKLTYIVVMGLGEVSALQCLAVGSDGEIRAFASVFALTYGFGIVLIAGLELDSGPNLRDYYQESTEEYESDLDDWPHRYL